MCYFTANECMTIFISFVRLSSRSLGRPSFPDAYSNVLCTATIFLFLRGISHQRVKANNICVKVFSKDYQEREREFQRFDEGKYLMLLRLTELIYPRGSSAHG